MKDNIRAAIIAGGLLALGILAVTAQGLYNAGEILGNPTGVPGAPTTVAPKQARSSALLNIDQLVSVGNANYTILATDRVVGTAVAFTAPRTWTLPAASSVNPGQMLIVADFLGTVTPTNTLTIARAGSDTVNGVTSVAISNGNGAYTIWSDGLTKWSAQAVGGAAGGVTSIGGLTGVVGVANGIETSGSNIQFAAARRTLVTTQTFCASGCTATVGPWTKPANVLWIEVETLGAGGGSGGCAATGAGEAAASAGGGGGGFARAVVTAPGATETVTIGAAGAAGAAGNNAGGTGGTTSFGTWASAGGGVGGSGSANLATVISNVGGAGGLGATGFIQLAGQAGGNGSGSFGSGVLISGPGGMAARGGGGGRGATGGGGIAGGTYGGGAGGCVIGASTAAQAGAAGSAGATYVTEHYNW